MTSETRYEQYTCPQCGLRLPIIRDNDLFGNTIVLEEDSFAKHLLQLLDEKDMSIAILQGMVDVAAIRETKKDRRIEELEEELADEKAENGWAREFLNTIGPRCGKSDCPSLVSYVNQLEQLVMDMHQAIVRMIVLPNYSDEHDDELASFDDRMKELGIEVGE